MATPEGTPKVARFPFKSAYYKRRYILDVKLIADVDSGAGVDYDMTSSSYYNFRVFLHTLYGGLILLHG